MRCDLNLAIAVGDIVAFIEFVLFLEVSDNILRLDRGAAFSTCRSAPTDEKCPHGIGRMPRSRRKQAICLRKPEPQLVVIAGLGLGSILQAADKIFKGGLRFRFGCFVDRCQLFPSLRREFCVVPIYGGEFHRCRGGIVCGQVGNTQQIDDFHVPRFQSAGVIKRGDCLFQERCSICDLLVAVVLR